MKSTKNEVASAVSRLNGEGTQLKRKFAPNLSKALSKKSFAAGPLKEKTPRKPTDEADTSVAKRGRINRRSLEDDGQPRYVQTYSMFEKGIGCVVKTDNHTVELRAIGSGASQTSVSELVSTELKPDPVLQAEAFVKDIRQCFKDPPTCMLATDFNAPLGSSPPEMLKGMSAKVPSELFDETAKTGSLFTLHLPPSLLAEDSPVLKEGKFGKIQLLENGESRLLISDSVFHLRCPKPAACSSDIVLVEEQEDGLVDITSLGHVDQFLSAVPDFQRFARIGR